MDAVFLSVKILPVDCKLLFSFKKKKNLYCNTWAQFHSSGAVILMILGSKEELVSLVRHRHLARADRLSVLDFNALWQNHERILGPSASFYTLHSFLLSSQCHVHFLGPRHALEGRTLLFLQLKLPFHPLIQSFWLSCLKLYYNTNLKPLNLKADYHPYWVTSPSSQISALCSLHTANACLGRRKSQG